MLVNDSAEYAPLAVPFSGFPWRARGCILYRLTSTAEPKNALLVNQTIKNTVNIS
jgi:hypothetical protein